MKSYGFKRLSTIAISAISAIALAGCGQNSNTNQGNASTSQGNTIRIGYVKILAEAPAIVGKDEGIFKKDGLNAKFYSFSNGPALYKAMAAKQIDIGYAGVPQAVAWASRGMNLKVIAKVEDGKFGLIAKKTAPEQTVKDFRGKSIAAVSPGSGDDLLLRGFLLPSAGLTAKDVKIQVVPQANMEGAVNAGDVDGAFLGDPFLTYARLRGAKVIKTTRDPGLAVIARGDLIKNNAGIIKKFIKGHEDSIKFLNDNAKKANQDLAKAFNIAPVKADGKTYTPSQVIAAARKEMTFGAQFTASDLSFYQKLTDADYKLGYIPKSFDVKKIISTKFVNGD